MPEENNNTNEELVLDEVTKLEPDELSEDQKSFLEEHKDELSDEQVEKFGIKKELEEEERIEPEVRTPTKKTEEEEEPEEEEEILPEDKKAIKKVVDESLKPLTSKLQETADQTEVDAFIRTNPEFSKYRSKILTYMKHPAYRNIPASNIAKIVAGDDLIKIGAQKEREARKKVEGTKSGGHTAREPTGKAKDWSRASKEEVDAKTAEILGRRV